MKNLKIALKLTVGFGAILAMFLISVIVATFSVRSVTEDLDLFYNRPFMNVSLAMQIDMNSEIAGKEMLRSCVDQDTTRTNEYLASAQTYLDKMVEDLATLKDNYTGNTSEIDAVSASVNRLSDSFQRLAIMSRSNNITGAYQVYSDEISDELIEISNLIGVVREHASNVAADSYNEGMAAGRGTMVMLIIMGIAAIIVGILLALYITRSITSVISQIQNASQRMSKGDFNAPLTYESRDELGDLSNSMREMIQVLKQVIQDIGFITNEMAGGNLTVRTNVEDMYMGELRPILDGLRKMKLSLNDTMNGITTASEQVNAGADQVSSGAQGLAQGATQQASAVEELAATINEISNNINTTADHAETAKTENLHANEGMELCASHMNDLVSAMQVIEQKSSEVSKISKAIEDIAFQTNILALNAAVEAARAGSAGKGFAVVADEVRNLASKSAEAAKSTTSLIEETINAVNEGTRISGETQESLSQVVTDSRTVLDAVINISGALNQQSEAIKQITQGIDQISSVVQTNSATAEESAAASEELSGQAQMLKELVGVFNLDTDGHSIQPNPAGF